MIGLPLLSFCAGRHRFPSSPNGTLVAPRGSSLDGALHTFDTALVTHGNKTAVGFTEDPAPLFQLSDLVECAGKVS